MPEYRLNVVFTEHGRREVAEDNMELLLDAFHDTHPEVGAVIASNFHLGRMDATFSVVADDAKAASPLGLAVFTAAADESGLERTEIVEINVQAVDAPEAAPAEPLAAEPLPA